MRILCSARVWSTLACARSRRLLSRNPVQAYNTRAFHDSLPALLRVDPHRRSLQDPIFKDTIFALATPPGKAGVAVIRISGPAVQDVWRLMISSPNKEGLTQNQSEKLPQPRQMVLRDIKVPSLNGDGEIIDQGLVVYFAAPKSFTTEPLLEIHTHSSTAVISKVLSSLAQINGCRPAERGEFTKTAFMAGRMDLTEVEGLKDLIDAETEGQRKLARGLAGGDHRIRYEALRTDIIHAMAIAEALIDFGEDDNIGDEVFEQARDKAKELCRVMEGHLNDSRRGELMRSGVKISIFGPPNAGKSSLLNHLSQRDAAIVSPIAGTTRDIVSVALDLDGIKVILSDTAGLRVTEDQIESKGIAKAEAEVVLSDIRILVLSLPVFAYPWTQPQEYLRPVIDLVDPERTIVLFNQSDLLPSSFSIPARVPSASDPALTSISVSTEISCTPKALAERIVHEFLPRGTKIWVGSLEEKDDGLERFLTDGLGKSVKMMFETGQGGSGEESPLITHQRHRHHLQKSLHHLQSFLAEPPSNIILATEYLRLAAREIGKVSGREIGLEDVLDRLFGEFCIGK
ncbi:Mitochondrial GTPase [Phaffia rhodozyma]|uniref:Mitochondrial GTPase n=1 Tax=Phaffia rhodozyma TaxID=264483 RepID=A0A0F7SJ46_PHARH|nr:Mitochondrial GTPase [Phaffia rhodozyma]